MGRGIAEKLGHKPGLTVRLRDVPAALVDLLPTPTDAGPENGWDLTLAFVVDTAAVGPALDWALTAAVRGRLLWFAYPKKTGAIRTDITRDTGWDALAPHDLLPVTQIALDDTWSALRFRYRDEIKVLTRKF